MTAHEPPGACEGTPETTQWRSMVAVFPLLHHQKHPNVQHTEVLNNHLMSKGTNK